jgi:hypothetical protein
MVDPTQTQGAGQDPNQQLQVKVPDEVQKGVYSNAVSVNVNSNEVVVDFGYLLPNTPAPVIEVVSRVNMNHKTAESFLNVLSGAMEDFKKKQAEADAKAGSEAAPAAPAPAPAPMPAVAPAPAPMPAPGAPTPPPPPLPENM